MKKEHPLFIESLTKDIEEARRLQKKAEADVKYYENLWIELFHERQEKCSHKYADGTSAWKDYYAYSQCEICGYDDL